MNFMASKAFETLMIGMTGPKISSFITSSVEVISTRTVGSMKRSSALVLPPTAILPFFRNFMMRLKKRASKILEILGYYFEELTGNSAD